MAFLATGVISFLIFKKKFWVLSIPILISLITILGFFHSERYILPVLPVSLAIAASGLQLLFQKLRTAERKKAIVAILIASALLLSGRLWPVPEIPEGQYLYNRAAKAFNMQNHLLALTLFEESIEASPSGSSISVHARMEALRISQALNLEDRTILHTEALELVLQ